MTYDKFSPYSGSGVYNPSTASHILPEQGKRTVPDRPEVAGQIDMYLAQKRTFDHPHHMAIIEAAFQLVGVVLQSILDYAPGQASWENMAKAAEAERRAQSPFSEQDGLAGQKPDEKN